MRLRICEEQRAMPANEKPPARRVDVYLFGEMYTERRLALILVQCYTEYHNHYER